MRDEGPSRAAMRSVCAGAARAATRCSVPIGERASDSSSTGRTTTPIGQCSERDRALGHGASVEQIAAGRLRRARSTIPAGKCRPPRSIREPASAWRCLAQLRDERLIRREHKRRRTGGGAAPPSMWPATRSSWRPKICCSSKTDLVEISAILSPGSAPRRCR